MLRRPAGPFRSTIAEEEAIHADIFYTAPDGLRLYARDYGSAAGKAPTILCMPGLTRNSRDFAPLAEHLAVRHRVVVAEQRGRGRSAYDPEPGNYQPGTYVRDMTALLDHLAIEEVALIGTSLGGLMAMIMAAAMPDRVAGVVLNDIGPEIDPRGIARIQSYVGKLPPARSWREAEDQTRAINAEVFPDFTDDDWHAFTRALCRDGENGVPELDYDPAIAAGVNAGTAVPPDLWPLFEALKTIPTLAFRGAHSDLLSAETFAEMQRRHPHMTAVTVARRGHAPTLDEPVCRGAIDGFLVSLAKGGAKTECA